MTAMEKRQRFRAVLTGGRADRAGSAIHDALRAGQGDGAMPPLAGKELTDWGTQAGDHDTRAKNFL